MRRWYLFLLSIGLLATVVAWPRRAAWTQGPGQAVPDERLDAASFSLGELLEGDAPLDRVDLNTLPAAPRRGPARLDDLPAPVGYSVDFRHYPTSEETSRFLDELARDFPDLAETQTLGTTWQDRPIRAIRIANERVAGPVADRPAMYLDAQHHARELISGEVALYTAWWLLDQHGKDPLATYLVDTRVLYVVPSVNPDGNDIVLKDFQGMRKTANPSCCDDDMNRAGAPAPDGRVDEDYSQGFGYGSQDLFRYHFDQAWADQNPNDPFVPGWQQHEAQRAESLGRYTGALGGALEPLATYDMDGDGQQNEDEIGGVDPNRNYDAHWPDGDRRTWAETYRGPAVWSEPEARAVRDLVQGLDRLATGISYHSGTDLILHPWGWSETAALPDASTYELLSRKGSQLTEVNGFQGSPHTWTARGLYRAAGSTMDWLYEQRGVYAWSPEVYSGDGRTRLERLGSTGSFTVGTAIGFSFNPVPGEILASTDRWNRFATYVLAATPNIELNGLAVDGTDLVVTVGNDGILPASVLVEARTPAGDWLPGAPTVLAAAGAEWRFPLAQLALDGGRLRARATSTAGFRPHEVEVAEWGFTLQGEDLRLDEGRIVPFPDLGERFGGWWAPDAFDEPGRYHLPGNRPIPVTPPATPTAGPSQTPLASATASPSPTPSRTDPPPITPSHTPTEPATDTPEAATATATATATSPATATPTTGGDRAGRLLLPWLYRSGGR